MTERAGTMIFTFECDTTVGGDRGEMSKAFRYVPRPPAQVEGDVGIYLAYIA